MEEDRSPDLAFYDWLDCFWIYKSIRLEAHPTEMQGLIKHMMNVKSLHCNGKDATEYDIQFRQAKAQHPGLIWGEMHYDLIMDLPDRQSSRQSANRGNNGGYNHSSSPPQRWTNRFNKGFFSPKTSFIPNQGQQYCWFFNSLTTCLHGRRCKYQHLCKTCNGRHAAKVCKSQEGFNNHTQAKAGNY